MATVYTLGCDPGKSGACVLLGPHGVVDEVRHDKATLRDLADWLKEHRPHIAFGVLEKVAAMPRQGVSSTFKFGQSFGHLEALLVACGVPHELVAPGKWQGAMGCRTKGDKNVTKLLAQRLFPDWKIIHANADAILLAEYARRLHHERSGL